MPGERMRILTPGGLRVIDVDAGSPDASMIGRHWNAIKLFRDTGDSSPLSRFTGVAVGGRFYGVRWVGGYQLATDLDMIRRWAYQGELDIDDPYEPLGGGR